MQRDERDKNAVLCWFCCHIVPCTLCEHRKRPTSDCPCFRALGTPITYREIAERLETSEGRIKRVVRINGATEIVKRMSEKGIDLRFDKVGVAERTKFYEIESEEL